MGPCKTCRHWVKATYCGAVDWADSTDKIGLTDFAIYASVQDYKLRRRVDLKTGPDFGCVQYQSRSTK